MPDDIDDRQWLRLISAFNGATDFRMANELATDFLRALRSADEEHETMLPALQTLHVQVPVSVHRALWDSVEPYVILRQLSGHPVRLTYGPTVEEVASTKR